MREEFVNGMSSCIFTDEGIYYKWDGVEDKYYPYGSILKIKMLLFGVEITDKELDEKGKQKKSVFTFAKADKSRLKEMVAFASNKMATAAPAKSEDRDANNEHYMRCNVCGNIFCYSDKDIIRNMGLQQQAKQARNMAISEALVGTRIASNQQTANADNYESQIVDYSKCPHCNSTNLTEISIDEVNAAKDKETYNANAFSSADELKKFKELLDMGVISQEEFDAKKKQLLGL